MLQSEQTSFAFLHDGGESGDLIRNLDWHNTPMGPIESWGTALRTTLGLMLHSAFPMLLFWGDEQICFYNDAFRPSLGNNGKHPAIGISGEKLFSELWAFPVPLMEKVASEGKTVWYEDQLVPIFRNGKMENVYWTFSYSPAYTDDGTIKGVFVTCTETTGKIETVAEKELSRKKAEESAQQVRSLVDSAPFPIGVYIGKEMRIALANQSIIDIWGKGEDVVGKLFSEILPELSNQEIFEQLDAVYTSGIAYHSKNQRVDLFVDGKLKIYHFNYSFTPLTDAEGKIYGVMNTAADVTDLNLAKQKVEQSEANFKNIILRAPVAMCLFMGRDYIIEIANDSMIEIWGKVASRVMNKPVFEALPDARNQGLEAVLLEVFETGETFIAKERPVSLLRKGKWEDTFLSFVYEAYRDTDGSILGILAIAIEVTEQVLARQSIEKLVAERTKSLAEQTEALATANNSLQRSNAELEQFAYIASHDLQEPLRKVSTFAQMLEQSLTGIDDRSKRYLDKINVSTQRMINLVRDVLSLSQLSQHKAEFANVDLNKVIDNILVDFELVIEQKSASVEYKSLPTIEAIPLQMTQLFGNLISNALKFTKPGHPPEIKIVAELLNDEQRRHYHWLDKNLRYYHLEFCDNGIGFEQDNAEKIFDIFKRLHGRNDYAGTGIGLSLCKKIAENHQGSITARGASTGATFHLILPAAQS